MKMRVQMKEAKMKNQESGTNTATSAMTGEMLFAAMAAPTWPIFLASR